MQLYFTGKLIGTTSVMSQNSSVNFEPVATDRLGSVRARGGQTMRYFPYGQEMTPTTTSQDKFGTYFRDASTGLDYADQRYYASGYGRFMTADPSMPGKAENPASWNMYGYVEGDPVNLNDPEGLEVEQINISYGPKPTCLGQRFMTAISSAPNAWLNSDVGTMALQVYFEWRDADTPGARNMWNSLANAYRNRWHLSNVDKRRYGFTTAGFKQLIYQSSGPSWNKPLYNYRGFNGADEMVYGVNQQNADSHWAPNGYLKKDRRDELLRILNGDPNDRLCAGLISSFFITKSVYGDHGSDPTNGAIFYLHSNESSPPINPFRLPINPVYTYQTDFITSVGGIRRNTYFYRPGF